MSQEEKDKIKDYQRKNIKNWFNIQKINNFCIFLNINNEWKNINFNNIILNKKKFHRSKEPIDFLSENLDPIVISYKFKHNDEGFKH